MRRESCIKNYIPWQFHDRMRAISEIDYKLRHEEGKRYQTRIKMGLLGLELHKKVRGTRTWEKVVLPDNLPPVDLTGKQPTLETTSPPPGRPRPRLVSNNKRDREPNSDSESEPIQHKSAKQDNTWQKTLEMAVLVTEGSPTPSVPKVDKGNFINIEGTPSKVTTLDEVYAQSPIISKSKSTNN